MMPSSDFLADPRLPTVIPQPRVLNGVLPLFSRITHSVLSWSAFSAALISTNRIAMGGAAYTSSVAIGRKASIIAGDDQRGDPGGGCRDRSRRSLPHHPAQRERGAAPPVGV